MINQAVKIEEEWIAPPSPEAYYGLAGDFVRLVEPETEASSVGLLTNFLVVAGTLFGREAFCKAGEAIHYPAEFVIQVGATGSGRKGTAGRHALKIANAVEEGFSKNCVRSGLSSGEGLIKAMQKGGQLGLNRFLGYLPEFGSLLTCARREGNTVTAVLRQSWDADPLEVSTKTDPLYVSDYFLSIVGHITEEELLNGLASVDLVNGLANRFLFCKVRRSKFLPNGGEDIGTGMITTRLHAAIEGARNRGRIRRDENADRLWSRVYQQLADQPKGLKGALCSRAEAHVLRLSLIYALLDGAGSIRVEHLQAALAVWNYCERSISDIFAAKLGDPKADKILRAVESGPKTMSELHRVFGNNETKEWLEAKISELAKKGLLIQTIKDCDRKSVTAWDRKRS